jgi:hypothetical protein
LLSLIFGLTPFARPLFIYFSLPWIFFIYANFFSDTRTVFKSFYAFFALTPFANLRFFILRPPIFGLTPFATSILIYLSFLSLSLSLSWIFFIYASFSNDAIRT